VDKGLQHIINTISFPTVDTQGIYVIKNVKTNEVLDIGKHKGAFSQPHHARSAMRYIVKQYLDDNVVMVLDELLNTRFKIEKIV